MFLTAFVTAAYAQTAAAPAADPFGGGGLLIPMIGVLAIFYFMLIRPQQQREKERREMMGKVRRGDTVVLNNGMIGKVNRVPDNSDEIEVELSDTLKVRVIKSALLDVRSKNEPVKDVAAKS